MRHEKQHRYSIRKTVLGVGSVAIATLLFLAPEAISAQDAVEFDVPEVQVDPTPEAPEHNEALYGEQTGIVGIETELSIVQQYTEGILWRLFYLKNDEFLSTSNDILATETEDWEWYLEQVVDLLEENESRHDNPYEPSLSPYVGPHHEGTPEQLRYHFTNILTRLDSVTPEQVVQFNQESEGIENTMDIDNIFQDILIDAIAAKGGFTVSNPDELESYKGFALFELEMNRNLTEEQIAGYRARVEAAETTEEIDVIIEEAREADFDLEMIQSEIDYAVAQLREENTNLTEEQLTEFENRIRSVTNYEDIHTILYEAFDLNLEQEPGDGEPGDGEPGDGEPGDEEPGEGEPGDGEPGDGEPGDGEPGDGEPGDGEPGDGEPGDGEPGDGEPGDGEPGDGEPGDGEPGDEEPGDEDGLEEYKALVTEEISGYVYLTAEEITDFLVQVEAATTQDEVNEVLIEATSRNAQVGALEDRRAEVIEAIGNLPHLTEEQVTVYQGQAGTAATVDELNNILADAEALNEEQAPEVDVEEVRAAAIAELEGLENLTDEAKANFLEQLNTAETAEAIETILAQAVADNVVEEPVIPLEDVKAAAVDLIEGLDKLTSEEVEDYTEFVNNASTEEQVQDIVSNALALNASRVEDDEDGLEEARANAKALVEGLKFISEEERSAYLSYVENAQTLEGITDIIEEVQALDAANRLEESKASAVNVIDAMANLTDEQRLEYKVRIGAATDLTVLTDIVNEAYDVNQEQEGEEVNLDAEKSTARAIIDTLTNLSQGQRDEYKAKVGAAETSEAINEIIQEATVLNEEQVGDFELEQLKAAAIGELNSLGFLTEERAEYYRNQILNAESIEEVYSAVASAQAENQENMEPLDVAKQSYKSLGSYLEHLTEEEREDLNTAIDAAQDYVELDAVFQAYTLLNLSRVDEIAQVRDAAYIFLDGLAFINPLERHEYKAAVVIAETADEVREIVGEAQELNAQRILQSYKDNALKVLATYTNLTGEQRAQYGERISKADTMGEVANYLELARTVNVAQYEPGDGDGNGNGNGNTPPVGYTPISPTPTSPTPTQPQPTQQGTQPQPTSQGQLVSSGDIALFGIGASLLAGGVGVFVAKKKKEDE